MCNAINANIICSATIFYSKKTKCVFKKNLRTQKLCKTATSEDFSHAVSPKISYDLRITIYDLLRRKFLRHWKVHKTSTFLNFKKS